MISYPEEYDFCLKKNKDLFEISRLINLNFDVDVIVAKSIAFISDRLQKRVRIYLLDDRGNLVIKQWSGDYKRELHKGIVVRKGSIVWDTFEKGGAINITDETGVTDFIHTLNNRIKIKAIIPLKYKDVDSAVQKKFGVMVIDSGRDGTRISNNDFIYSVEIAELIGQAIARAHFFSEYRRMSNRLILIQEEHIKVLNMLVHELRNPLTVIGGFTKKFPGIIERLYATIKVEQRNAYLDKLLKYSKIVASEEYRIEEAINDFIAFLKVTDPTQKLVISKFSLTSLIKEVISRIEPLAEIKHIKITYSKKDIVMDGDKEGIFTVLNNIIYNGINFSPENTRITIFTNEKNEEVSFSVRSDTFIQRQYRQRIFDYYYRIVGKEDKGTGLGLPIAKQIVENHRGTIKIISGKPRGHKPFTRFIVKLPKRLEQYHAHSPNKLF